MVCTFDKNNYLTSRVTSNVVDATVWLHLRFLDYLLQPYYLDTNTYTSLQAGFSIKVFENIEIAKILTPVITPRILNVRRLSVSFDLSIRTEIIMQIKLLATGLIYANSDVNL